MTKQPSLWLCGLALGVALLSGCSAIHRSELSWSCTGQAMSYGRMSPYCTALMTGHTASSLPSPIKKAGFSIELPKDEEWVVIRNTETAIAIARAGKNRDESYVLYVQDSKLPDLATPQAFRELVDKQRAKDTDPKRFTTLSNEETLIKKGSQGALCLRYHTTAIDHHAEVAPSRYKTMHTTNMALTCRSPADPHLAVTLVYSHRYHLVSEDKPLSSAFNKIAATLRFVSVGEATKDRQTKL